MPWTKIPKEHHPVFLDALPAASDVSTLKMFGGLAAMVHGHMAAGLFARSAFVRLPPADQTRALALEGAAPFDPMGKGRGMRDLVMLPEEMMERPAELSTWLARAVAFTRTLPPKAAKKQTAVAKKKKKKKKTATKKRTT